ncbi:hypothetical protein IL306_006530 [Fusarium sp. DS 682]|nr:hypothetical protein IL306_006530 [Fusarium sp. DS 682]
MRLEIPLVLASILGSAYAVIPFTCFGGHATIPVDEIQKLRDQLANNDFSPPIDFPTELKAQQQLTVHLDTAKVCVENNFLFDNTHVAQNDVVDAVQILLDECRGFGGRAQIKGDSGLNCNVLVGRVGGIC